MGQQPGNLAHGRGGRIVGSRNLTVAQAAFVAAYLANGGRLGAAATSAGYANPESEGTRLKNNPRVAAEIRRRQVAMIELDGPRIGFAVLSEIARDKAAPAGARVQAAAKLLGAGHAGPSGKAAAGFDGDKPMSRWTLAELDSFISAAESAQAAAHSVIEGESEEVTVRQDGANPRDGGAGNAAQRPALPAPTPEPEPVSKGRDTTSGT